MTLPAQSSMRAAAIHQNDGPEVLKYEDAPQPQPKDAEIFVRVMAAAVNPVDVAIRKGRFGGRGGVPSVPGIRISGNITPDNAEQIVGRFGEPLSSGLAAAI
jgi:NADPH:quinone reductase-like Zn-dependent oxidoreductase